MTNSEYQLISENPLHLIYRREDPKKGKTTIIKKINSPFPSAALISQLRNEYESARKLSIKGLRKSLGFTEDEGSYSVELEYIEGKTLHELCFSGTLGIKDILLIIIRICDILNNIHEEGFIHGSINGSNVIVEPYSLMPTIIDGSLMSRFKLKVNYKFNIEYTKSILPYISPEQSGRTSKALDHRTDFYSMGVMAYELFTGQLPFTAEDSLELIYAHLSKKPSDPAYLNPAIPPILSKILLKLLSKDAEDRYQSSKGLKWDLERVLANWDTDKSLDFELGERDFTGALIIPQKLYGRDEVIHQLNSLVEKLGEGYRATVFVSGESGTGKSAFVQEIKKPITKTKGFFLEGKFDQLNRNIPYSGWIGIFEDFIQQILTSGEKNIQTWIKLFLDELGQNIGILYQLIPSLEYLLGAAEIVEERTSSENQNRLNDLLTTFFRSISSKEHPIAIFIDDLQWADNASIHLLKQLSADEECRYLMLVGAYRSEEVNADDQIFLQIKELEESGIDIVKIYLNNLEKSHIKQLLKETLGEKGDEIDTLSEIIYNKTGGNPYFATQFLESLYEEGLIKFDRELSFAEKTPVWRWDQNEIKTKYISANVVELLVSKIKEIPAEVKEILKNAACIGNNFTLFTLATVRKSLPETIFSLLEEVVRQNYIYYIDANQIHGVANGKDMEYQFAHDKVQQAFYSLIERDEKRSTHYELGRLITAELSEDELKSRIFEVVFHLNFGQKLISTNKDKLWLAKLNLIAGNEAKKISAFDSSHKYLSFAQELVEDFVWPQDRAFAMELGTAYLDSLYLSNHIEKGEELFAMLIERVEDNMGKAELFYRKMMLYQHLSKIDGILALGLEGLSLLGIKINTDVGRLGLVKELSKTSLLLRGKSEEYLTSLPEMNDPRINIAMFLLAKSQVYAFDRNENLMGVISMKLLQLSVKHGIHAFSMGGFNAYGGLLSVGFRNYDAALKYNRIAIAISTRAGTSGSRAMAHFGMGMIGFTNLVHDECLNQFKTSVDLAMQAGAHIDAAPGTMYLFALNYLKGMRLTDLRQITLDNLYLTAKIKTDNFHLFLLAALSVIDELKGGRVKPVSSAKGEQFSYEEIEQKLIKTEHNSIRIYSRILQMLNHVFFDRLEEALVCEKQIEENLNVTRGSVLGLFYRYIQLMLYSRVNTHADWNINKLCTKKIVKAAKSISQIAKHNPECYLHWELFSKAEVAKLKNKPFEAQKFYDSAIERAGRGNFINDVAIINFFCALFNRDHGHLKIANHYIDSAIYAFKSWGADHLSKYISNKYGFDQGFESKSDQNLSIDQQSFFKLSQLISGEIDFDQLIKKLMKVFCENAGAERAVLILKEKDDWTIAAEQIKENEVAAGRGAKMTEEHLSLSICEYVIRTRKAIILNEANNDNRFNKTQYILSRAPRSIICLPLIKKQEITGLVYLENNLTSGVFHVDSVKMLKHISSQIAVSIDNAKLYLEMSELNRAYERFVPREFLRILGKQSITEVKLGDQVQKNMSVLFADIRGFTALSEKMSPTEIFTFINDFLSRMSPIIKKYHGFVDKFIGDEIMALFPESADHAVQCGIAMMYELNVFSSALTSRVASGIQIGIGVNTGSLMLGTVGVENRMNSTVISDTVNTASRVEQDTKNTGASFMITKATYDQLVDPKRYGIRKLPSEVYFGKSSATILYEVFEGEDSISRKLKKKTQADFEKGVKLIEKQEYGPASNYLQKVLEQNPDDVPCKYILRKIKMEAR